MKQRIVIEASMTDLKSRSKAMKIAAGVEGVESAAITGPEKSQVEVVGYGIDAVILTKMIRKSVVCAEIVSVSEVKEEEAAPEEPPEDPTPVPPLVVWPWAPAPSYCNCYWNYPCPYHVRDDPSCSIM